MYLLSGLHHQNVYSSLAALCHVSFIIKTMGDKLEPDLNLSKFRSGSNLSPIVISQQSGWSATVHRTLYTCTFCSIRTGFKSSAEEPVRSSVRDRQERQSPNLEGAR